MGERMVNSIARMRARSIVSGKKMLELPSALWSKKFLTRVWK